MCDFGLGKQHFNSLYKILAKKCVGLLIVEIMGLKGTFSL